MISLGIDTSSTTAHAALVSPRGELRAVLSAPARDRNAEELVRLVRDCLDQAAVRPVDLSLIAVALGPGSFTGIRSGIAAVQGLAAGLELPVLGVSSLLAGVLPHCKPGKLLMPLLSASAEELFCCPFRSGQIDGKTTLRPLAAISTVPRCDLDALLEDIEVAEGQPPTPVYLDFSAESSSPSAENPAVLTALTAQIVIEESSPEANAASHLQLRPEGIGLQPLYVKKAAAKTIKERQARG